MKKSFDCQIITDCTVTRNAKLQAKIEQELPKISSTEFIEKASEW